MNIGAALIAIGLATRFAIRGYRAIRTKSWRTPQQMSQMHRGAFYNQMTRRQAELILNITPGTDVKTVKDRHRKLMLINHPDNGGSTFLAAKINQAKDLLSK